MARLSEHGIRLSSMSPSYLNSNSTSHTWPFSAVAELIDNASDPGVTAKQIWIDVVGVKGEQCLCFTDNGSGMTPSKLHKMLSFGFTEKGSGKSGHQPIGVYGNGFKSGSMRLGRDALIFTKNGGCQSVGMLSQTFLQAIRAQAVIVPIAPFNQQTKTLVVTEDSEASLKAILTHSLLSTEEELQEQLDSIPGKKGTKILIWNIRRNKDGKPEFDFETDQGDIRLPEIRSEEMGGKERRNYTGPRRTDHTIPEMDYSLRAYLSILYLKPRIQIILRQKKVQTKLVAKSLSMIENDVYKPHFINERVKITFGFNRKNKDHFGIMMYHKNRLIKAYEKVGCQIKSSGQRSGVGVIGVIECNFLKPAHNKQDFEYTKEYRLTLAALGLKLNDYWREKKEKKAKEREIMALEKKKEEDGSDDAEEVDVTWIQCEECLKWRGIPTSLFSGSVPDRFTCSQHPIARLRSCLVPEETEDNPEDLTPSYEKTHKKQDQGQIKKRQKSSEENNTVSDTDNVKMGQEDRETEQTEANNKRTAQPHSNKRKATWPVSETVRKSLRNTESTETAVEREKKADQSLGEQTEEEKEIDQPVKDRVEGEKETEQSQEEHIEKVTDEKEEEKSETEMNQAHEKQAEGENETEGAEEDKPERQKETEQCQEKSQTNDKKPVAVLAAHDEKTEKESTFVEAAPLEDGTSQTVPKKQAECPASITDSLPPPNSSPVLTTFPHPFSPSPTPMWTQPLSPGSAPAWSHPLAQTVVVPPLSRSVRQRAGSLVPESSDRPALTQKLAQLEREAKRLRHILGMSPAAKEPGSGTAAGPGRDKLPPDMPLMPSVVLQSNEMGVCKPNAERLNPTVCLTRMNENSTVVPQTAQMAGQPFDWTSLLRNGGPPVQQGETLSPTDELFWNKKSSKLHCQQMQPLVAELSALKKEKEQLQNRVRLLERREAREKRDQSTNTMFNTYDSMTLDRLRLMRRNVVALLSSILPHLDLQGISYDTSDVDNILQQIIEANGL
ncbi:MORC family CW-type zinc finger protein 4 isoform X2 [Chanos chanos]|uniref:MORC family CW-type zinc finger protein 4 isoform X2 n=1 Tax=Chanos chanos TaxID=29144 RepID=A0A6J2UR71_CHACN|nr:MORC family CW-type zinc finger protein 4-like isoform X2 [Chanos chanos]